MGLRLGLGCGISDTTGVGYSGGDNVATVAICQLPIPSLHPPAPVCQPAGG